MAAALRTLGVEIADDGTDWLVTPAPLHGGTIDTGLAGTVMRFVPPLAALADGDVTFDGDAVRPRTADGDPARRAAPGRRRRSTTAAAAGCRSRCTAAGGVPGGAVRIDASASSQFVSGPAARRARATTRASRSRTPAPGAVPSQPHIDMTLDVLRAAGVDADAVEPGELAGRARRRSSAGEHVVEPDLSNAAPFLAAALVTGGDGARAGLAARARPRPATRCATCSPRWAPTSGSTTTGSPSAAPARSPGSTPTCATSASSTPSLAALAALADGAVAAQRPRRTCAGTRPTGSPRCTPSSPGSAARSPSTPTG